MNWFNGTLDEAIANLKTSKKILLVYLYAKDDPDSDALLASLTSCNDLLHNFVCIRLEAASVEAAQLNVYYPVMVIPLIYLINHEGCALVSVCGSATEAEMRQKLNEALTPPAAAKEEQSPPAAAEEDPPPSAAAADVPDASPSPPTAAAAVPEVSSPSLAPESDTSGRAEYARQRLEEVRRRKEAEEREKEKALEQERRTVGKQMTNMRNQQREQEQKELKEELKKRRAEEKEARDRVKRQIEEDRRERSHRFAANTAQEPPPAAQQSPPKPTAPGDGDTRLQFRLPDGSNVVQVFRGNDRLRVAYEFIREQLDGRFGEFTISSLYPRRRFGSDDMDATLAALSLAPSAAIVVLAGAGGRSGAVAARSGGGGSAMEAILAPLLAIWAAVWGLLASLFGVFNRPAAATNASNAETQGGGEATGGEASGEVRRRGNVTRLGDLPRDDDDVNTWNGNSTQQM